MTLTLAPALSVKLYNVTKTINGEVSEPEIASIWFPVPADLTTLPSIPEYTINSEFVPVNSTEAPEWFDPDIIDLEQFFNDILPTTVASIYPIELQATTLIEAQNEIIPISIVTRTLFSAFYAGYSLEPQLDEINLPVKNIVQRIQWVDGQVGSFNQTGQTVDLIKSFDPVNRAGSYNIGGQTANFLLRPIKLRAEPYSGSISYAKTITLIGGEANILDKLEETDAIDVGGGITINYDDAKFGESSIQANGSAALALLRRPNKSIINTGQDFTVSFWCRHETSISANSVAGLLQLTADFGLCYYRPLTGTSTFLALGFFADNGSVPSGEKYFTSTAVHGQAIETYSAINHIAVESYASQLRIYINGLQAAQTTLNPNIIFDDTNPFSLFGFTSLLDDIFSIDPDISLSNDHIDDLTIDNFARYGGQNFLVPVAALGTIESTILSRLRSILPLSGDFNLAGQNANFSYTQYKLVADASSFIVTTQSINFKRSNRLLQVESGAIILTGQETNEGPYFVVGSDVSTSFSGSNPPLYTVRTFTPPSGYQIDDIMVFVAETTGDADYFPEMTGWNLISNNPIVDVPTSAGSQFYVWWRRILSTREPAWSLPVQNHIVGSVFLIRNADPDNPIAALATASTTTNSTSFSAPGVSLSVPLTKVFVLAGMPADSSSTTRYSNLINTSLSSLTEHFEAATSTNNGGGIVVVSGKRLKSGTVGNTTMTKTLTSTDTIVTVAFKSRGIVTIPVERNIEANAGAYAVTTQSATLIKALVFNGEVATFNLTGYSANLNISQGMFGDTGLFNLNGQSVSLITSRVLNADQGSTIISGQDIVLKLAIIMDANSGPYVLTGQASDFIYNHVVTGDLGSIILNGQDATLTYTPAIGSLEDQFELTALLEDDLLTLDF